VKPERPIDSASAQSSWPGVTGEPGDLFTPRNPHTTPSRSHPSATPLPSRAHQAVQAGLAETPANQSAPPPRRWPFPLPPSLVTGGCAVLAISGAAVSVLLITAHYHRTSTATPPLVTQISGPAAASMAAPPSTTMVPRVPADAAIPSRAPAQTTNPAVTLAAPAPKGPPQAVDPQARYPISQHPTAASLAAPPSPPAPQDSPPPPPPWSADQPSRWQWDKTTTCDPSGHCVDHYNPKPTTPGDGSPSPPVSNTTGGTQPPASWQHSPWDAPHDTTPTGP
jgi:hypothetical protein